MQSNVSWYAVVSKHSREAKANSDLKKLGLKTFYPRNKVRTIRKYRGAAVVKWLEKAHFPRYLFVRSTTRQLALVRRCEHVSSIVSLDVVTLGDGEELTYPTVIPDSVMDVVMAGADPTGLMGSKTEVARARFKAMQTVKFNESSALQGVLGKVIEDDGTDRIRVLLKMLGKEHVQRVPVSALEAA
jgi:transcription antitermination factor NusG